MLKDYCRRLTAEDLLQKTHCKDPLVCHLWVAGSVHVPVCLRQSLDMYRGRLRTMMVTGDHYMTASAVAHSLGIFEKGSKRVVLDMISAKPAASEAPAKAPQQVSKATAAVASRFGGTQHKHQDPMQAALRHSVTQDSRLIAASSPSPRVTFRFNADEDSKLAAVSASLQESLRTPSASSAAATSPQAPAVSASPAAAPSQQAPAVSASPAAAPSQHDAVSAAATVCQLSAHSFSCAPAVHAADAAASPAASPAAAIAASSALFRSSSQQAASLAASLVAATSAATSAASPAPAKVPSRLLDSYLQSMGMAKSAQAGSAQAQASLVHAQASSAQAQAGSAQALAGSAQAQAGSTQAQAGSAQAQAGSAQAAPLHAQSRFANRYKFMFLHAPQALHHTLDIAFTLAES